MSEPHVLVPWSEYLAAIRGSVSDRYARFYAPLALVLFGLSFAPVFDADDYGTIFDMAGRRGGEPAVIGLLLMVGLVAGLTLAAFRTPGIALLVLNAALAALIAVMLIAKPGTGDPTPDLSGFGTTGVALAIAAVLLSIAHAIHLALLPEPPAPW
jgi:hypothetical protein